MNKVVEEHLKNIYIYLPCEVVSVASNSLVNVKPMLYNDIPLPIIVNIPIMHLGSEQGHSIKLKVKSGDKGLIMLSQMDISNFMKNGTDTKCETAETFNLTNSVYIPFLQWTGGGTSSATSDLEITMGITDWKGDIELLGDITQNGDTAQTGDVVINGDLTVNGNVVVSGNVNVGGTFMLGGLNMNTFVTSHKHGGVQGGSGTTGGVV